MVTQISMNLVRVTFELWEWHTICFSEERIPASDGGPVVSNVMWPLCVAGYVVSAIGLACGDLLGAELSYPENLRNWVTWEDEERHLLSLSFCVISLIRHHRYYFFGFTACFLVDTIWGRCLIPWETHRQQQWLDKVTVWAIQWRLLDAVWIISKTLSFLVVKSLRESASLVTSVSHSHC